MTVSSSIYFYQKGTGGVCSVAAVNLYLHTARQCTKTGGAFKFYTSLKPRSVQWGDLFVSGMLGDFNTPYADR